MVAEGRLQTENRGVLPGSVIARRSEDDSIVVETKTDESPAILSTFVVTPTGDQTLVHWRVRVEMRVGVWEMFKLALNLSTTLKDAMEERLEFLEAEAPAQA